MFFYHNAPFHLFLISYKLLLISFLVIASLQCRWKSTMITIVIISIPRSCRWWSICRSWYGRKSYHQVRELTQHRLQKKHVRRNDACWELGKRLITYGHFRPRFLEAASGHFRPFLACYAAVRLWADVNYGLGRQTLYKGFLTKATRRITSLDRKMFWSTLHINVVGFSTLKKLTW